MRFFLVAAVLWTATPAAAQVAWLEERSKGAAAAPVTIFEVADFQCPACRDFFLNTLPALERDYIATGKVRLTFVNLPLVSMHPNATPAHEFAMCAAAQNRFWPVHDLLYRHQPAWAPLPDPSAYFSLLADSAGVNRALLERCISTGEMRELVLAEGSGAVRNGIRSTPSFVIDGGLLSGSIPMSALAPVLDSIISSKAGSK